ncbi:hypothetical protein V6N11_081636 [Hibiscus sabdariffa]|uniref:Uncharacterized protein n=1 Tax=Hibiscus sabdariffa TaxID=183260 RepID=A0ABR2N8P1_9ROSI
MEDGASSIISNRHQKRSISYSDSISSTTPLNQSASSSCVIIDQTKISYISFQAANGDRDDESRQESDTLLSVVNPHLCHRHGFGNYGVLIQQMKQVAVCSPESDEQYPHFSRVGEKPSRIKTRLKWTAHLHDKFVGCVNLLGGAESEQLLLI